MDPLFLSISLIILLFSVILHEVMHGVIALKFGDHTAERAGRLSLNPLPHIDPIGTILVPGLLILSGANILFGWAKPVPVNPLNFNNIRKGEFFVSIAGVGANFGLAIFGAIAYHVLVPILGLYNPVILGLIFLVKINLLLGTFNLIPIPPLDGSNALLSQLPYKFALDYQKIGRYGVIIIFILLFFPFGGSSILSYLLYNAITIENMILQVPLQLI